MEDFTDLPDLPYEVDDAFSVEAKKPDEEPQFHLMDLFPIQDKIIQPTDERDPSTNPFVENWRPQLLLEWDQLTFQTSVVEPIFCSVCIIDSRDNRKITENFYFNINNDFTYTLLGLKREELDPLTLSCQAIFSLSQRNPEYRLLVIVEKVLEGGFEEIIENYIRAPKQRDVPKVNDHIRLCCQRLGRKYTQLLCFGIVPLFNDQGDLLWPKNADAASNDPQSQTIELMAPKSDGDSLQDLLNDREHKKTRVIGSNCRMKGRILDANEEIPPSVYRVSSAGVPVLPCKQIPADLPRDSPEMPKTFQKEMVEFNQESIKKFVPYNTFWNLLYVYPLHVNLSSSSGRNVAIKVSLMDNDFNLDATPLECIFEKVGNKFVTSANSTVFYHQTRPNFYDEIKIKLPINLNNNHHLLFTFYHVKVTPEKKKDTIENVLGYAFLPVYPLGTVLEDKDWNLPITQTLSSQYLTAGKGEPKWLDGKKSLFSVKTVVNSSILTQDPQLSVFFKQYEARLYGGTFVDETAFFQSLALADPQECINYFPTVMRQLFWILCNPVIPVNEARSKKTFAAVLDVLRGLRSLTNIGEEVVFKSSFLESYVKYMYKNPVPEGSAKPASEEVIVRTVHEEICKNWVILLKTSNTINEMFTAEQKQNTKKTNTSNTWEFAQFLFAIIFKSMALTASDTGELGKSAINPNWFKSDYLENLQSLCLSMMDTIKFMCTDKTKAEQAQELTALLAYFIKDLFYLLDPNILFGVIQKTIVQSSTNTKTFRSCKLLFLSVVTDMKHFVPLNSPTEVALGDVMQILPNFTKRHFLCGILLGELVACLHSKDDKSLYKAIEIIRNLIRKHDLDPRYQHPIIKEHIAGIYFPLIPIVCESVDYVENVESQARSNLLISFIWVLKCCNLKMFREWFSKHMARRLQFFQVMSLVANQFEYPGKKAILERMLESPLAASKSPGSITVQQRKNYIENMYTNLFNKQELGRAASSNPSLPSPGPPSVTLSPPESREHKVLSMGTLRAFKRNTVRHPRTLKSSGSSSSIDVDAPDAPAQSALSADAPTLSHTGSLGTKEGAAVAATLRGYKPTNSDRGSGSASPRESDSPPALDLGNPRIGRSGSSTVSPKTVSRKNTLHIPNWMGKRDSGEISPTSPDRDRSDSTFNRAFKNLSVDTQMDFKQLSYLSNEVNFVLLHFLDVIIEDHADELAQKKNPIMESIVPFIILLMQKNQSSTFQSKILSEIRKFLEKFSDTLFVYEDSSHSAGLTLELLRYSNSSSESVRTQAWRLLYDFVKVNYQKLNSFSRMKLNVAIGISKLVGDVSKADYNPNFDNLRSSLDGITSAANEETDVVLRDNLQEVVQRLFQVLGDSVKIVKYRFDPETTADLFYQISNGYTDSPELRVSWMEQLFSLQVKDKHWEEAGQCLIGISELVTHYLNFFPNGSKSHHSFGFVRQNFSQHQR
eukprot:TRINITY_DN7145_c0_g1_i3.p1 TRINITY_DN7145_c0_g1~~TRINITY_DN7145_c0_g1_i3.p1  ORF type:complete len:1451 (+),score=484.74 TRINITY_DN7145_c0_g1_i3:691-5043(+)